MCTYYKWSDRCYCVNSKNCKKELSKVSFISVVLEVSNRKSVNLDDGLILVLPNSWNHSEVFISSFCQREKYGIITNSIENSVKKFSIEDTVLFCDTIWKQYYVKLSVMIKRFLQSEDA